MITGATSVYALLGHPVRHSPSPALHNRWFAAAGIDAVYVALPAQSAPALAAVRTLGLAGANVTIPLKEVAVAQVDVLEPSADIAGAVNTLWWDGSSLVGANTDGAGFVRSLADDGVPIAGRSVVVVGAGGAARGIAAACMANGVGELTVLNRTEARAHDLVARLATQWPDARLQAAPLDSEQLRGADLVAVTVSADVALDPTTTADHCHWIDISTAERPPSVLRARAAGRTARNGMGMLMWQAALAFERWTGALPLIEAPRLGES